MINPYQSLDFGNNLHIPSMSHCHCRAQDRFEALYSVGTRHFAISNYYPSEPFYPLSDMLSNVPQDAIGCPNAEHHNMLVDGTMIPALHINSLGSTFSSNPDSQSTGVNQDWMLTLDQIFDALQYDDGGGVTINHPKWTDWFTQINMKRMIPRMLDYDDRVLGIEIYNHSCEVSVDQPNTGYALDYWDEILRTGRRCWGLAVPDHHSYGRNVLLVPEATEYECLKAYRNGHFYCRVYNTDLKFSNLSLDNYKLTVETNSATSITIVTSGERITYNNSSCEHNVNPSATYVRVEAKNDADEIYSQPIMLKGYSAKKQNLMMWY